MKGNGQEQGQPPQLGDVRLQRVADGWELWIAERRVLSELSLKQALAIIRGEFDVDALRRGELVYVE